VASYLLDDERGAGLVEYALLIALIALAAFVAVVFFGSELSTEYSDISNTIP
jgi:Flp pilus assembly pilin Flp